MTGLWLHPKLLFDARREAAKGKRELAWQLNDRLYCLVDTGCCYHIEEQQHSGGELRLTVALPMGPSEGGQIAAQRLTVSIPASWQDRLLQQPQTPATAEELSDRELMLSEYAWPEWPRLYVVRQAVDPTDIAWLHALKPKRWKVFRHQREDHEHASVDEVLRSGWTPRRDRRKMGWQ